MKRLKLFKIDGKDYIFDGNSVSIITGDYPSENVNFSYRMPNSHRTSYLKTLCLVISNCCNLSCKYCFANHGMYDNPNKLMTFEIAKKAIDFVIKSVIKHNGNKITISFFGGEPLINFRLIKQCVNYIETFKYIKCNYMITTNGTLLSKSIVDFLQKFNFDVMISIDGTEILHNYYRKNNCGKGSYDDVVRGIHLFNEKNMLNARVTVNDNNAKIHTYIDDLLNLGFKRITFAVDHNISTKAFLIFIKSLKKLVDKYYYDIMSNNFYDITNFSSFVTTIALHHRKLTFCNAGISYLTVSADGKYYKCPRLVGKTEYLLGCIEDLKEVEVKMDIFKEKLKNTPGERNEECRKCVYAFVCGGMCYYHSIMSGKNEFENVYRECYERKTMYGCLIEMICKLPKEKRRELLLFYKNLWSSLKGGTASC